MPWHLQPLPFATDAFSWFRRLEREPMPFILESHNAANQRYDIIGAAPSQVVSARNGIVQVNGADVSGDAFAAVQRLVEAHRPITSCPLDLPFQGGAVGYFGYELNHSVLRPDYHGAHRATTDPAPSDTALSGTALSDTALPDMLVGIYDAFISIDHHLRTAHLVCSPAVNETRRAHLLDLLIGSGTPPDLDFKTTSPTQASITRAEYDSAFNTIKDFILAGDCYQVNYTQRFSARYQGNPVGLYAALRLRQRAPFSACLRTPDADILSFSPERLVRLEGKRILTQPIKGTRGRDPDPTEDQRLASELQNSEKDRAENLMIVDLLRNDLGKTAVPGSVKVERLFELVSFANVHHLVSTISAELRPDFSAMDLLRACFPGGSVTGAPKHRAMQIIDALEPVRRNAYCGAIGYYSYHGNLDTNLPIRTLVCSGDTLHYWGGGGIVADSEADLEYAESRLKVNFISEVLATLRAPGTQAGSKAAPD
jgi:para-aminobenzoate synthetase component 1